MQIEFNGFDPITQNKLCRIAGRFCDNAITMTDSGDQPLKTVICKTELFKTPDKNSAKLIHELQKYETSLVAVKLAATSEVGCDKSVTVHLQHGRDQLTVDHYKALRALIYVDNKKMFMKTLWEQPKTLPVKKLPGLDRLNKVA
jgi:hypothetical protein